MTPVRSQGNCGSCWAFATMSMLEGMYWKLNKNKAGLKNEWLSPQELVDCDTTNGGCDGGWYTVAIKYYVGKKTRETEYPYLEKKHDNCVKCKGGKQLGVVKINSSNKVTKLYNLLVKGPVAVAVGVASNFLDYKKGIFDGSQDCTSDVNHAVVVVGYGTLDAVNYWIVRNSWDTDWGENGYININADVAKDCSVSKYGYQAVLKAP